MVSVTTGTGSSPSLTERYGVMTRPSGIFDLPTMELELGIALAVHRWYEWCAFAKGEFVKQEPGGSRIGGGGNSRSRGSGGEVSKFVVYIWKGF
jgi:hypothetical protein